MIIAIVLLIMKLLKKTNKEGNPMKNKTLKRIETLSLEFMV